MLKSKLRHSTLAATAKVSGLLALLLKDQAISGKLLLVAAVIALCIANSSWFLPFESFWQQHLYIGIGNFGISETLRHWVDEGLMAVFFLVIGLEIKREIVRGELRTLRAASLPIVAGTCGMILAIAIYMSINVGRVGFDGWGIPMTTDTALALGVLALLGNRIPPALKIFLLAVMVVDDLTAIITIAIFYNDTVSPAPLLFSTAIVGVMFLLQWIRLIRLDVFVALGILLWLGIHASGVHASIAGAIMGLAAPIVPRSRKITGRAIAERLERALIPVVAFIIIPLFALANTGVILSADAFKDAESLRIGLGIVAGLVIGKSLGIVIGAWLIVRLGITGLPQGVGWGHIIGSALLAGIGFTLSIFIAELAFANSAYLDAAKLAIFAASILSAVAGLLLLRFPPKNKPTDSEFAPPA